MCSTQNCLFELDDINDDICYHCMMNYEHFLIYKNKQQKQKHTQIVRLVVKTNSKGVQPKNDFVNNLFQ